LFPSQNDKRAWSLGTADNANRKALAAARPATTYIEHSPVW
jgi:hypothetical protein